MEPLDLETDAERHVWSLLTRDFNWHVPADFPVKVYGSAGDAVGGTRLQVFEVAVAAIFARLRPDYNWYVTPNRPDGGLDFVGEQRFLEDAALGIAAAITVGGQCKKRNTVNDIVGEVAGSLARMAATLDPTFFVIALSARLNRERVENARVILERVHQRHCHILDRRQLEGLLTEHLPAIDQILREALNGDELREVRQYFAAKSDNPDSHAFSITSPSHVLAGVPFTVTLKVRSNVAVAATSRLWWRQRDGGEAELVVLVGPLGADSQAGVQFSAGDTTDDLFQARQSLELVTHTVGEVNLGEIVLGHSDQGPDDAPHRVVLGSVRVVENVRPRFFERPFRACLTRLSQEYERALANGIASVGVVGAGGSGKSRLCEEFALERRRRGGAVVSVKHPKTLDDPHRILADILISLVIEEVSDTDPAESVIQAVAGYDHELAGRAATSIQSIFGVGEPAAEPMAEQDLLSSMVVLLVARGRRAPLVVHVQDLHWCAVDVLLLLERLVWQLGLVFSAPGATARGPEAGILFLFEGRVRERQVPDGDGWDSGPFEAFLQRVDCPVVSVPPFDREDGLEFVRRLFEARHSARRMVSGELLELQTELVRRIDRAAGGNPFHSLAEVQLLKARRVIGQNPNTGLLYLIQPELGQGELPRSIFEAIELRWQDLKARAPQLALLIWATGILEDRIPWALFRRLWTDLAADVSLGDVDATGVLWTGESDRREVAFRHEHFFRTIRQFEVEPAERAHVVDIYCDWFASTERSDPSDVLKWAQVLLEHPDPDVARARKLLRRALQAARRRGDRRLARRVAVVLQDVIWNEDARSQIGTRAFIRSCEEELALTREFLESDRLQAANRLEAVLKRIEWRLAQTHPRHVARDLERLRLAANVLHSQVLFNDRQAARAAEVAAAAVNDIAMHRSDDSRDNVAWSALEMEALHAQAVSLALSGEISEALQVSERAVELAGTLSSPLSHHVISTHANILLARDPDRSETILRGCLEELSDADNDATDASRINLSMALVLRAHRLGAGETDRRERMIVEADTLLLRVFGRTFRVGRYPAAAAAALMLGITNALHDDPAEVSWFAQAVAAAARGRQMETLWRAHINLATALYRRGEPGDEALRDHARAALEIMEDSLSPYAVPDSSPRFALIRVPLAQAVRFLLLAGDEVGLSALEHHPALRGSFSDPMAGTLVDDPNFPRMHEWLRLGTEDYVLY